MEEKKEMSTNYNKLLNNLEELKLYTMKDNLDDYITYVNNDEKNMVDALYELTEKEKEIKKERAIKACIHTAGFPFNRTINDYDFGFQPSVNKKEIEDYGSLRFLENNENILFVGSSGVGKTHLATAIGIEAAKHRYSVYFITCQNLMSQLKKAEQENRLEMRLKAFTRHKLLIIDEIGYINLDKESANLFFQLISMRYETKSTIITTNRSLSKWSETFGDPVIANAILDRLLHHSHVVSIVGPSYRMKDALDLLDN
jgi:DNA replication protein DnaC